jgi:hypothetical protein
VPYRVDAGPGTDAPPHGAPAWEATVAVVGCGGTGGFLAEAVARLLLGRAARLFLIDPDRVEPHNVARQAFDREDVGRFKAEVLAGRLARRFGREVGYSVLPYDAERHARVFGDGRSRLDLLVGCVDNGAARRALAAALDGSRPGVAGAGIRRSVWWLDAGNGRNSGQVLLGNATRGRRSTSSWPRSPPGTSRSCSRAPAPGRRATSTWTTGRSGASPPSR